MHTFIHMQCISCRQCRQCRRRIDVYMYTCYNAHIARMHKIAFADVYTHLGEASQNRNSALRPWPVLQPSTSREGILLKPRPHAARRVPPLRQTSKSAECNTSLATYKLHPRTQVERSEAGLSSQARPRCRLPCNERYVKKC